jgi:hypothetical protein
MIEQGRPEAELRKFVSGIQSNDFDIMYFNKINVGNGYGLRKAYAEQLRQPEKYLAQLRKANAARLQKQENERRYEKLKTDLSGGIRGGGFAIPYQETPGDSLFAKYEGTARNVTAAGDAIKATTRNLEALRTAAKSVGKKPSDYAQAEKTANDRMEGVRRILPTLEGKRDRAQIELSVAVREFGTEFAAKPVPTQTQQEPYSPDSATEAQELIDFKLAQRGSVLAQHRLNSATVLAAFYDQVLAETKRIGFEGAQGHLSKLDKAIKSQDDLERIAKAAREDVERQGQDFQQANSLFA